MKHPATIKGNSNTSSLYIVFLISSITLIFTLLNSIFSDGKIQEDVIAPGQLETRYRAEVESIFAAANATGNSDNCNYLYKRLTLSCRIHEPDLQAIKLAMTNRAWVFSSKQFNEASRTGVSMGSGLPKGMDLALLKCSHVEQTVSCFLLLTYKINL